MKHANIQIELEPEMSHEDIVERVAPMLEQAEEDYGLEGFWDSKRHDYSFTGKGLTGEAHIEDEFVSIHIKTSAFLGPFAGRIERELRQRLKKALVE